MVRAMVEDAVPLDGLKRVLVIKLRHHGDVLLTSPVLSVLKNHAPHLEIDALVYAETAPMLALHPALSMLHTIDRKWKASGILRQLHAEWRLLSQLRRRHYDLIVHLTDHPRGATLARLLRPRYSVAPKKRDAGRSWERAFTHLYSHINSALRHTVEKNLDALRRIGVYPTPSERGVVLEPGTDAYTRIDDILAERGIAAGSFVHFHPASRWLFKCWTIEKNAELLQAVVERGHAVVMTAAPDARELRMCADIAHRAGVPVVDLSGQLSLKDMAALSARARIFVGVDSAPMHIAAAMKTPTLALFGPSGDVEWGPWGTRAIVVTSPEHLCRPCGQDGCGGGKVSECLTMLPVARVLAAFEALIADA